MLICTSGIRNRICLYSLKLFLEGFWDHSEGGWAGQERPNVQIEDQYLLVFEGP